MKTTKINTFSIENYAVELFTKKFGSRVDLRFKKLEEEYKELTEAYEQYNTGIGSLAHLIDEVSDLEAVLAHIRCILSDKTHDHSILDAVMKVRIREYNKEYRKDI